MTSSSGGIQPVNTKRKLIRTVSMNLETMELDELMESIDKKVTELDGYIENSDISGSSIRYGGERSRKSARITARIPSDHLSAFITEVEANGNVTNKQESVEDVTLSYADVESRKKTLLVEQERLWALLEKADTTEAIITLESRLSEIRYQLESYESQLLISYSPVIILCLALLVIVWWAVKIQANRNKTDIQEEGQEKKKGMFRRRKDK